MQRLNLKTLHAAALAARAAAADAADAAKAAADAADAAKAADRAGHDAAAKARTVAAARGALAPWIVGAHGWAADAGETATAHRRIASNYRRFAAALAAHMAAARRGHVDTVAIATIHATAAADPATAAAAHPMAADLAAASAADLARVPAHRAPRQIFDAAALAADDQGRRRRAALALADAVRRDARDRRRADRNATAADKARTAAATADKRGREVWIALADAADALAADQSGIAPAARRAVREALDLAATHGHDAPIVREAIAYAITLAPETGARTSYGSGQLASYLPIWRALAAALGDDHAAQGFWGQRDTVSAHVGLSLAADDGRAIKRTFEPRHGWRNPCADAAKGTCNVTLDPDWI